MRSIWLVTCAAVMAFVPCSLAQQDSSSENIPPSAAEIMRFYAVMHTHDQMQKMLQVEQLQVRVEVNDLFSKMLPNATGPQHQQLQDISEATIASIFKDYPIDDMLRDMIPVYQKHLTESDLNAVVNFYSSPVGQKLLREMPTMTAETMRIAYSRLQPRIQDALKEMQEKIQAVADTQNNGKK